MVKWITLSEYVDVQTGEIITKSEYERKYIKLKTIKTINQDGNYKIKKFTYECERNGQTELFD